MRRKARKNQKKSSVLKIASGALFGSLLGATVGWLTAPTSGEEMRRRIKGEMMGAREMAKTAMNNVESKARELAAEGNESAGDAQGPSTRRRKATSASRS
jgi:gas vesicle protein